MLFRSDHHVGPEPAVAADMYRLCPTEMLWVALGIVELTALTGEQGMHRGYDGDVWAEVAVVTDGNLCVVLYGKVKVGKKPLAYLSVLSIMEGYRTLYAAALVKLTDNLVEYGGALFILVLMGHIVVHIKVVGAKLYGHKLRVPGGEQYASVYPGFFLDRKSVV